MWALFVCGFFGLAIATEWWNESTFENAKSLALMFDRESKRHNVWREGHIAMSTKQMEMYYEVARAPWVKTICETGFNAGHSAAIFMVANPQAKVISFDLGQFGYTMTNLKLMKELFGDRFEYILGDSRQTIPEMIASRPDVKCDVFSIDGGHDAETVYHDIVNFRQMANCRNWVLADDAGFQQVNLAWQQGKDDGHVFQHMCLVDYEPTVSSWQYFYRGQPRTWCSGYFNKSEMADCPVLFEKNPNTNVTKCEVLYERGIY